MRKFNFGIIGAVFTALLSTLCCLPAFLFIFFGVSSGVLTYFTTLDFLRIPMAVLTIILFIIGLINLNKKLSCACSKKDIFKQYLIGIGLFLVVVFLLLYPEIIPLFMD
jgi:mercuric ion transport protein